jgi:Fe-S-cluster containining protein
LVTDGDIALDRLYTIRKGEPVRDDVAGGVLIATDSEIIKIREAPGSRACIFLDPDDNGCLIYERRPVECRALRCWDTGEIRQLYRRERLARNDLMGHIDGLRSLLVEHDRHCGAARLCQLARRQRRGVAGIGGEAELRRMVAYDEALRLELVTQGLVSAAVLDFLLGRSLARLLRSIGISVVRKTAGDGIAEPRRQKENRAT